MSGLGGIASSWTELAPWTDRRGRFNRTRALVLILLILPGVWLTCRALAQQLGAEPLKAAIHSTGYWAVWTLIASLAVSPARAMFSLPKLVVLRRMIGNAALCYAAVHLGLYVSDQNWRIGTAVSEIFHRFYLMIGLGALFGLCILGFTSTDAWVRKLGPLWKRLHKIVYVIMSLGIVHYLLQSKLDVSLALLASGVFTWLMLWRCLPAGPDRRWPALSAIATAAALLTLLYEYLWYRFGTGANPNRVIAGELDVMFGLHPAMQVLVLGAVITIATEVRRLALGALGVELLLATGIYCTGALVIPFVAAFNGWSVDAVTPDGATAVGITVTWALLFAALGVERWKLRQNPQRHLLDLVWAGAVLVQIVLTGSDRGWLELVIAIPVIAAAALLGGRVWTVSRAATLLLLPLSLLLAYQLATVPT